MKTIALISLGLFLVASTSFAQQVGSANGKKQFYSQGIDGYADRTNRDPVITLTAHRKDGSIQLRTDAYVKSKTFSTAPIRFEFFVNRELVATQIRSATQPGAVGIEVPPTQAEIPFALSVVATVMHPNRTFTSILNLTIDEAALATSLSCTLTSSEVEYTGNATLTKKDSDSYEISLPSATSDLETPTTAALSGDISVPTAATASLEASITTGSSSTSAASLTGTVTLTDGEVTGVDLSSVSGGTSLDCE